MATQYYFMRKDDEICSTLAYFKGLMEYEGWESLNLYKAEPVKDGDHFYCTEFFTVGETGWCGKQCKSYQPRNGKSGCCKYFSKQLFVCTDEVVTITYWAMSSSGLK